MESTIVRIEFGSHLYGTNTPTSDHDYKSVYVPSASDILLQKVKGSTGHKVKRYEHERNAPEDTDDEAYSLQRYLSLLAEGQTVTIDMLFAPKPMVWTPLWWEIQQNKDLLLTKRSAAFVGYCRTQANKYGIKGSRVAAAKEAKEGFERWLRIHGPSAKVFEVLDDKPRIIDEHTRVLTKETTPGKFETYFECCNRMVGFKNTLKEATHIYTRIYEEYGHRARLAQTNEGIDWKALSHAVRVANEALELLETHHVTFPLPNAAHILAIKRGTVSYAEVAEEIEGLLVAVERASESSTLREVADQAFIDDLIRRVHGEVVMEELSTCQHGASVA
jgi:RNA repair pathway DNA polymerase beta family